jgi:hypothetical protein
MGRDKLRDRRRDNIANYGVFVEISLHCAPLVSFEEQRLENILLLWLYFLGRGRKQAHKEELIFRGNFRNAEC